MAAHSRLLRVWIAFWSESSFSIPIRCLQAYFPRCLVKNGQSHSPLSWSTQYSSPCGEETRTVDAVSRLPV